MTAGTRAARAVREVARIVDGFKSLLPESDLFTALIPPECCRPADNMSRNPKPLCCLLAAEPPQRNQN